MKPIPNFAPYFDPSTALPGQRSEQFKGYLLNLPEEQYRAWPGINSSVLKEKTPCQMLHSMREDETDPYDSTKAKIEELTVGKLLHWAVLEPHKLENPDDYMVQCETKGLDTVRAGEQRADPDNAGKLLVTQELLDLAYDCLDAVRENPDAMELLNGKDVIGSKEATGMVFDTEMQIWRKWRVDFVTANTTYMVDVKTTRRDPDEFEKKDCPQFGYLFQSAWYMDCHEWLTRTRITNFYWIVVNKSAPFMCRVVRQENMDRDNPIYEESKLAYHRQRLGLDSNPGRPLIGRLQMFINSARDTEDYRGRSVPLKKSLVRQTWPAYESESPIHVIF